MEKIKIDYKTSKFFNNISTLAVNSEIVREFDNFLELVRTSNLELTKSGFLNNKSAIFVNENCINKLIINSPRPQFKNFINVNILYLLFVKLDFSKKSIKANKSILGINDETLKSWNEFDVYNKYLYLFSFCFNVYDYEILKEENSVGFIYNSIRELLKESISRNCETYPILDFYSGKLFVKSLEMFGLAQCELKVESKKWEVENLIKNEYTNDALIIFINYIAAFEDNDSNKENYFYIADYISSFLPKFTDRIDIKKNVKRGIFEFKVKFGSAIRTLLIDSRQKIDELCNQVLLSMDFDNDHMYEISFPLRFGNSVKFYGAPDISYAEDPTTIFRRLDEVDIDLGANILFNFDYGANWKFEIQFIRVLPFPKDQEQLFNSRIIEKKGKSPEQYPEWE